MKKLVAVLLLGVLLVSAWPLAAEAGGGAVNAALALGAFAVFSQFFLAPAWAHSYHPVYVAPAPVYVDQVYAAPRVVYVSPPATYAAPPAPPAIQREVVYPHGRYQLYGDGVTVAYQWVWIPNPPPPPPAASAVPAQPPR